MLRLATQKRRLKSKVQELTDDDVLESRSGIVAFPSYAHDAPTRTFVGRIDTWKLPPPPRIPVLDSFLERSPSHSESSVPPVAMPAATQKIRAALGEITGNTLLIVHGRPSVAWAAGLLAIGICFGAFLARPGRSELGNERAHENHEPASAPFAQDNAATEILAAAPTSRAPTVSEVPVPPVVILATPAPVPAPTAPARIAAAKTAAAKKPLVKKN